MSKARQHVDIHSDVDYDTDSGAIAPFVLPEHSRALCRWLDEQPNFVAVERDVTLYRHDSKHRPEYPTVAGTRWADVVAERTKTEHIHVPGDYEITSRKSHSSQSDVMDAWEEMKFPSHSLTTDDGRQAAELYTLSSYTTDIDGPVVRRRGSIRRRGMNEAPGARFECSECNTSSRAFDPQGWNDRQEDKQRKFLDNHIQEAHDGDAHRLRNEGKRVTTSEKNFYALQFLDGAGRVVHYDTTAAIRTRNGIVLRNKQDFAKGRARVTYPDDHDGAVPLSGIIEYLDDRPESVYDIVDVETAEVDTHSKYRSDFTRTWYLLHFDSGAAFAVVYDETAKDFHERRCGFYFPADEDTSVTIDNLQTQLRPVEVSAYLQRNEEAEIVGSQQFSQAAGRGRGGKYHDPDRLGTDIVRQGEWFFIPLGQSLEDAMQAAGVREESDDAFRVHRTDALPRHCGTCDGSSFHYREDGVVECDGCGSLWFTDAVSYTETRENPLGSHRPRELVSINGSHFVRGMIRHDTRDHNAISLDDTWHLAIDNGRDGLVFDTSTPDNVSGRSGDFGGMRVE